MAAELLLPTARASDTANVPYGGAVWSFFQSGTSTPLAVYADADLSTSLGSTVTADAAGKFVPIYFDASHAYRGVLKDATGAVTLHDIDPINNSTLALLTGADGADYIKIQSPLNPAYLRTLSAKAGDFPVIEDGYEGVGLGNATADTEAFQAWATELKTNGGGVCGRPQSTYYIGDTVWLGTSLSNSVARFFNGNGATIVPDSQLSGKCLFDLVGIGNGMEFELAGWRYDDQLSHNANIESFISCGRPKQASGVKSSGNFHIHDNVILAWATAAVYRNVESESNLVARNRFFNYHNSGMLVSCTRHDYLKDTLYLEWDGQSGTIAPGDTLTGTSGTAKILWLVTSFGGGEGAAMVWVTGGTWADNDTFTSSSGGNATVNLPNGVHVNGGASTSPTAQGGVYLEQGSTSAYHMFEANYFNQSTARGGGCPAILVSDCTDAILLRNNFNTNAAGTVTSYVHLQQDMTKDPTNGQPYQGFKMRDNYCHSTHIYSFTFGDAATGGGNIVENVEIGPFLSAGAGNNLSARVKYVGKTGVSYTCRDFRFSSDDYVDLRGVTMQGANTIHLTHMSFAGLYLDTTFYGELHCDAAIYTAGNISNTITDTGNFLRVKLSNGAVIEPPETQLSIASGAITATRTRHRLISETGSADDLTTINLATGVPATGRKLRLTATSGHTITVKTGASILTPSDKVLDATTKSVALEGDTGSGSSSVFRVIGSLLS